MKGTKPIGWERTRTKIQQAIEILPSIPERASWTGNKGTMSVDCSNQRWYTRSCMIVAAAWDSNFIQGPRALRLTEVLKVGVRLSGGGSALKVRQEGTESENLKPKTSYSTSILFLFFSKTCCAETLISFLSLLSQQTFVPFSPTAFDSINLSPCLTPFHLAES